MNVGHQRAAANDLALRTQTQPQLKNLASGTRKVFSQLSLAILQRVCTGYRLELFRRLAARPELRVRVFIGDDQPGTKVKSAPDLGDLDVVRLPTRWLGSGRRWSV